MKPPSGLENGGKTSGIRCKETVLEQISFPLSFLCLQDERSKGRNAMRQIVLYFGHNGCEIRKFLI